MLPRRFRNEWHMGGLLRAAAQYPARISCLVVGIKHRPSGLRSSTACRRMIGKDGCSTYVPARANRAYDHRFRLIRTAKTMGHQESVRELVSVFHPSNDPRPTLLLGAGASFSSGVPLADQAVKLIAKRVYADKVLGAKIIPENVKTSEWIEWLGKQPWFAPPPAAIGENFPNAVKYLLTPRDYRRRVLLDLMQAYRELGPGYKALAELVLRGLAGTILTTNFDDCILRALNSKRPHLRDIAQVNRGIGDVREFGLFRKAQVVWMHGTVEQYTDKNEKGEISNLDEPLRDLLAPLIASTPLVVVGYRGAEASIMEGFLARFEPHDFRHGLYWCVRKSEALHPKVEALAARVGTSFRLLEIDHFDALMTDLDRELANERRFVGVAGAGAASSFDDRITEGASVADLNLDLALRIMQEYNHKLGLGPVNSATLRQSLRELGLLTATDGGDAPTNGALLLFGKEPQRFFRHAVVSVTVGEKRRQVVGGNLIEQRLALLEWLGDKRVNPILKIKGKRRHEEQSAYHERALVELVVNCLVHRDYEIARPATIDVAPQSHIRFSNPGKPPQSVMSALAIDGDGAFSPVRDLTAPRNRSLCDVFFGMNAMERAGTGLSDIIQYAREARGTAIFRLPPWREEFVAEIFQAAASGARVARDTRPIGTYVINLLPFASLPESVSCVEVTGTLGDISKKVPIDDLGTAIIHGGELWTFAPAPIAATILADVMIEPHIRSVDRSKLEADADLKRKLSWLLRKHFERHLVVACGEVGLVFERNANGRWRAYFGGRKGKPLTLVYDTPHRSNVRRGVVKQRGEGDRAWFENEGFGYEIVNIGDMWGVRIKPFYMFTGPDAVTPLPNYARAGKATRRMRFDRNKNVDDDLVFWSRFISRGAAVVNIGQRNVDDLLLEGAFLTIDLPEEGLIEDDDTDKNQVPA